MSYSDWPGTPLKRSPGSCRTRRTVASPSTRHSRGALASTYTTVGSDGAAARASRSRPVRSAAVAIPGIATCTNGPAVPLSLRHRPFTRWSTFAPATATHSRSPAGVRTQTTSVTTTWALPGPFGASQSATVTRLHGSPAAPGRPQVEPAGGRGDERADRGLAGGRGVLGDGEHPGPEQTGVRRRPAAPPGSTGRRSGSRARCPPVPGPAGRPRRRTSRARPCPTAGSPGRARRSEEHLVLRHVPARVEAHVHGAAGERPRRGDDAGRGSGGELAHRLPGRPGIARVPEPAESRGRVQPLPVGADGDVPDPARDRGSASPVPRRVPVGPSGTQTRPGTAGAAAGPLSAARAPRAPGCRRAGCPRPRVRLWL